MTLWGRLSCVFAALLLVTSRLQSQPTPAGIWRTISDVDGKPTALIEITESSGSFSGVVKAILTSDEAASELCDRCSGERKGQRILGMTILWGMHADGDEFTGGAILDPESGKVYKAKMRLTDEGRTLIVRGYIGFSLFGRSQTWHRDPPP